MQKSLDTAVSAIKAQQTRLDVTANNIANVNTVGFKKGRTLFTSMLNQSIRTASAATEGRGGTNPAAIGFGVQVSSIDTIHSQGILSSTGRALDLAIQGSGFFTVTDGQNTYYTRNGGINLSTSDGTLALGNGMRLMGYNVDPATGDILYDEGIQPITIPTGTDAITKATTSAAFAGNIASSLVVGDTVSIPFVTYDSLGTAQEFSLEVEITAPGQANWTVTHPAIQTIVGGNGTLSFDGTGKFTASTGGPIRFTPIGADPLVIDLDFSQVTMVDKQSDFSLKTQDGMPAGTVSSIGITDDGKVRISYTNGVSQEIASLAITTFDNPGGLLATNDSLFEATANSGEPVTLAAGENPSSVIRAGYLEGSNVDVTEELTEMIKTQRAYQMATKAITTSDEILQELMSMKR